MAIDIENPGGSETALRAAISNLKISSDSITTGASPTAASPETDVTFITTGATEDVEVVTLAIPSDPSEKIGRLKRIVLAAKGHDDDSIDLDNTNLADDEGNPTNFGSYVQDEVSEAGRVIELRLIYNGSAYKWQLLELTVSTRFVFTRYVTPVPNITTGTGLNIEGGYSEDGNGGGVAVRGGAGNGGVGGDVIIQGGGGGVGAGGSLVLKVGEGATNGFVQFFTDLPSHADDAAAATGGVPVGGLYRTASAVKIRVA